MSEAISWASVREHFEWDGSLRDIYVHETSADDWTSVLVALRESSFACEYRAGDSVLPLPIRCDQAFPEPGMSDRMLIVRLGGVAAHCHFFDVEEMELDLDPREIDGDDGLRAIVELMRLLARATRKECVLTPENGRGFAILTVTPAGDVTPAAPGRASADG